MGFSFFGRWIFAEIRHAPGPAEKWPLREEIGSEGGPYVEAASDVGNF